MLHRIEEINHHDGDIPSNFCSRLTSTTTLMENCQILSQSHGQKLKISLFFPHFFLVLRYSDPCRGIREASDVGICIQTGSVSSEIATACVPVTPRDSCNCIPAAAFRTIWTGHKTMSCSWEAAITKWYSSLILSKLLKKEGYNHLKCSCLVVFFIFKKSFQFLHSILFTLSLVDFSSSTNPFSLIGRHKLGKNNQRCSPCTAREKTQRYASFLQNNQ